MNRAINIRTLIPVFFGFLFIGLTPSLSYLFIVLLAICVKVFVIICIVDYFRKTSLRKNIGSILIAMLLAAIVSLLAMYITSSLHGN